MRVRVSHRERELCHVVCEEAYDREAVHGGGAADGLRLLREVVLLPLRDQLRLELLRVRAALRCRRLVRVRVRVRARVRAKVRLRLRLRLRPRLRLRLRIRVQLGLGLG